MKKKIAVIYGDGIGREVTEQAIKALDAVAEVYNHTFIYERGLLGAEAIDATGEPLPRKTIDIAKKSDAVLFGAVGDPRFDNNPAAKVRPEQGILAIRKELELYSNIRPVVSYKSLNHLSPLKLRNIEQVDFVIYRELSSGIYFGEHYTNNNGATAHDVCTYNVHEIERITHSAFRTAQQRHKKLHLVDKANVMETSRLWRKTVTEVARQYSDVELKFMYIDNAAMQLIINPGQFDVILTENLFGDILSDESGAITGSLGLLPSASLGSRIGFFEPVHGAFNEAAGKDIANPVGSILSAAMMLEFFNMPEEADLVKQAVSWTLNSGFVTRDIDSVNYYYTSTIGDLISDFILGKIPDAVNKSNIELMKSTII